MQDVVQFMAVSRRHDNTIRCGRTLSRYEDVISFDDKHTLFIILALKRGLISPGLSNFSGGSDHDRPLHVSSLRRRLQMNEEVEKGEEGEEDGLFRSFEFPDSFPIPCSFASPEIQSYD